MFQRCAIQLSIRFSLLVVVVVVVAVGVVVVVVVAVVVVVVSTSSSRALSAPRRLVWTIRLDVSILPTTIADDSGFLAILLQMTSQATIVADNLVNWVLTLTSPVVLTTSSRSVSRFETPIRYWFTNWVLPWLYTSPLPPVLLDLPVVILESDCRVNQFLEFGLSFSPTPPTWKDS